MKSTKTLWIFCMVLIAGLCLTLTACGGGDDAGDAGSGGSNSVLKVSSSVELLGTEHSTTTITVSVPQGSAWTVAGVPDWLSLNKSGVGSSTVTITATSENFSDTPREAQLVFTTSDNSATAVCKVSQKGVLAANCRVTIGDMTVMSDGFAGDLIFDADCKGYRELYLTPSKLSSMTEKDVFNELMKQHEYERKTDWFYSPRCNSETEIVYCIAAYGSETNSDNSHKYGPVTVTTVKSKPKTYNLDMYLLSSYNTSQWTVAALRGTYEQIAYGQRCKHYYWWATENEQNIKAMVQMYQDGYSLDAYVAHLGFKPNIKNDPDWNLKTDEQTFSFPRSTNSFLCFTWGEHETTGELSAELSRTMKLPNSSSVSNAKELKGEIKDGIPYKGICNYNKDYVKPDFSLIK